MSTAQTRATQALAYAKQQAAKPTRDWHNLCLQFVRTCLGVPALQPNAKKGWENADRRHPTTNPADIPAGVPVWFKTGTVNWHVALSAGDGACYSTDVPRGKISKIAISTLCRSWGITLLGWSEDINEVRVYTPPATPAGAVSLAGLINAARTDPDRKGQSTTNYAAVILVERALVAEGLLAAAMADGHYGTATIDAYARWQRALGYRGKAADGIPGKASLTRLGAKHGFKVIA